MRSLICFVIFLLPISAPAQGADSLSPTAAESILVVDSVTFSGNGMTEDFVIEREMTFRTGARITPAMVRYERERIYSLGLFTRVELSLYPTTPGKVRVNVAVEERLFIFPYPIFGLKDRDWSKVFYGIGLLHNNVRGRNEKLATSVVFGFDPSISLAYRNFLLDDAGIYSAESHLSASKVRNRSLAAVQAAGGDFDEEHFGAGGSVTRRFDLNQSLSLLASYEIVHIPGSFSDRTISPDGRDAYLALNLTYVRDTRDLREYPSEGSYARFAVTKYGLEQNSLDVVRYGADLRYYLPVQERLLTLKGRIFSDVVAGGATPTYQRTYFGYGERIRGHFKEVYEGEDILGVSFECDVPLLSPRYVVVDLLPRELGVWRYGVTAALFADAGTTWFRDEPLAVDRFVKGYGGGIHFLLPYSIILRTEYALSESRRGEFILGIGASF